MDGTSGTDRQCHGRKTGKYNVGTTSRAGVVLGPRCHWSYGSTARFDQTGKSTAVTGGFLLEQCRPPPRLVRREGFG